MSNVVLPPELVQVLTVFLVAGVTWLVVAGVKGLGEAFGRDFSKAATVVAATVSVGVVAIALGVIDALLGFIPAEAAPIVNQVFALVVILFAAFGVQRQWKIRFG